MLKLIAILTKFLLKSGLVADPIHEQNSVEVIDLMLYANRQQSVGLEFHRLAVAIEALYADLLGALLRPLRRHRLLVGRALEALLIEHALGGVDGGVGGLVLDGLRLRGHPSRFSELSLPLDSLAIEKVDCR